MYDYIIIDLTPVAYFMGGICVLLAIHWGIKKAANIIKGVH